MSWLEFLELRQHQNKGVSSKAVSATQEGTESEGEEKPVLKSQRQRDHKISAQSSQIRDLSEKLDGAVAENTQIREWFKPRDTPNSVYEWTSGIWSIPHRQ